MQRKISVVDLIAVLGPRRPSVHFASWWLAVVDHLGVWCRRGGATHDGCDGSGTLVFEPPGDRWNPLDKIPQKMCWKQKMGPKNMYFVNETAFGWATFVLFFERYVFFVFRYRLHTPLEVVGGFKMLIFVPSMIMDIYSKFVSWLWIHIPSLFHATGRFKDNI